MSETGGDLLRFADDFVWGTATSAFQIEGATTAGGRGESVWDRFCATPSKIKDASTGERACEHYERWVTDVGLMVEMGIKAYRFSISWPRVIPQGTGAVSQEGLDWYSGLVDALLAAGIEPWVTLYHWDLPQTLEDQGGWTVRSTIDAFAEYAAVVGERLGDRVKHWNTINEPWVVADHGYGSGNHAPGRVGCGLVVGHHLLVAHGRATAVLREKAPDAKVGLVVNMAPQIPATDSADDHAACRLADGRLNRWYLDPVNGQGYPSDVIAHDELDMSHVLPGDLDLIAQPTDFLGINYYAGNVMASSRDADTNKLDWDRIPVGPQTDIGWDVYPAGLTQTLERVHHDYDFDALYITECGAAFGSEVATAEAVADADRLDYLHRHFAATHDAIASGVPVGGFFVWSLLDNFEWAEGYTKRFGIIHVDFETLERTPKASSQFYADVISANALERPS